MDDFTWDEDVHDIDPDDLDSGASVDKEGCYHFEVVKISQEGGTNGSSECLVFVCNVIGAEKGKQDQLNRKLYHRIYRSDKEGARKIRARFALGLGIVTRDQLKHNDRISFRWGDCNGRQFVAQTKWEEGNEYEKDGKKMKGHDRMVIPFSNVINIFSEEAAKSGVIDSAQFAEYQNTLRAYGVDIDSLRSQANSKPNSNSNQSSSPAVAATATRPAIDDDDI